MKRLGSSKENLLIHRSAISKILIMSFPNKEKRQHCWDARDQYWQCLDKNAPDYQTTSGSEEPKVCLQFRKLFEKECSGQW